MKTTADALEWVRRHRIVLMAARVEGVPSLAHEIAQEPIKGSWWSHPKGKLIFALGSAVEDSGEVLAVKLVDGKMTFVHQALWPALLRVLLDDSWRKPRVFELPGAAKRLFAEVERQREVQGAEPKPVKALEESLLALVVSHHTARGHHEKVLTSWAHWAKTAGVKPAAVELDEALAQVRAAAHGVRVLA
jgi:hypothetical protein